MGSWNLPAIALMPMDRLRNTFLSGMLCVIASAFCVRAADITFAPPQPVMKEKLLRPGFSQDTLFIPNQVIRIEGDIVAGDAMAFQKVLEAINAQDTRITVDEVKRNILVSLNSKGGSFKEGVDIARLIDGLQIPTIVEAGSECLSACAVIFMAGTEQFPEGRERHTRIVEVPSRLGFHRPFISEFKTEIPPDLVAELGAQELQEIFAQEYLLAFDLANQLIQEMLAVDPNAWQSDLLVKMLTANNQLADGRFVYLSTVADAIEWDIEILNLEIQSGGNALQRYERAFWVCYNTASRVRFSDLGFWPSLEFAHEMLEWNIRPLREGVAAPNWVGPRIQADGRTFNVTMEQLGGSGCKVTFSEQQRSATVEFTTVGGPTESLYFSNPKDRIVLFAPQSRLNDLVHDAPGQETPVMVPNGRCLVYSNGQLTDNEPCQITTRNDPELGQIDRYIWPSGGATVVVRKGDSIQINGRDATPVDVPGDRSDFCVLNSGSGNIFCFAQSS